jgi:hypothetical protein
MSLVDLEWLAKLTPEGEGTVVLRAAVCRQLVAELKELRRIAYAAVLEPTPETTPSLTDEDREALATTRDALALDDSRLFAQLVHGYYRDADRADRTPRLFLYWHIGLLAGMCLRVNAAPSTPTTH